MFAQERADRLRHGAYDLNHGEAIGVFGSEFTVNTGSKAKFVVPLRPKEGSLNFVKVLSPTLLCISAFCTCLVNRSSAHLGIPAAQRITRLDARRVDSGVRVASGPGVVDADLTLCFPGLPLCAVQVRIEGEVKDL